MTTSNIRYSTPQSRGLDTSLEITWFCTLLLVAPREQLPRVRPSSPPPNRCHSQSAPPAVCAPADVVRSRVMAHVSSRTSLVHLMACSTSLRSPGGKECLRSLRSRSGRRAPDSCLKAGHRRSCAWVPTPFFCSYLWRSVLIRLRSRYQIFTNPSQQLKEAWRASHSP